MTDTESEIYTIEHREPEESEWSLDDLGFASWSDDVRDEIMRIVMATRPEWTDEPYTAADVVREIQEGHFGDTVVSALESVGALYLVGIIELSPERSVLWACRKSLAEQTGESMRSVIRRTRGFSPDQVCALSDTHPVPAITDDLRAKHDAEIFHANVRTRAFRLFFADDDQEGVWTDYLQTAYAQIVKQKPSLVA